MLSIIIPFYNEKEGLAEIVRRTGEACRELDTETEIILVDDGSTDGSAETIEKGPETCILRHHKNRGYGRAIQTGLEKATGEWVAIIDADGTYRPADLAPLWNQRDRADMVVAARERKGPTLRRPATWFLRVLAGFLTAEKIPDLNSGLRLFRRDLAVRYRGLFPDGFSLTTTITLAFLSNGHTILYHPITYMARKGKSKIRPIHDTCSFLLLIIRMILFFNPIKVLIPISILLFLAATLVMFVSFFHGRVMDVTVSILYMLSLHIAVVGFLADLIVRRTKQ